MIGAIALVVAILLFPVVLLMTAALVAAVIGWTLVNASQEDHEGSELLQLNQ